MSNLIQRGRATLARVLSASAGVASLTYTRKAGGTITLTSQAWIGRTIFRSNLEGAASIEIGDRDYLIPYEFLTQNGSTFEPVRGDRITEIMGDGTTEVYEIISPDTGETAWRWSDPQHTIYRLHTKQVA